MPSLLSPARASELILVALVDEVVQQAGCRIGTASPAAAMLSATALHAHRGCVLLHGDDEPVRARELLDELIVEQA